jgi:hypothetical protein
VDPGWTAKRAAVFCAAPQRLRYGPNASGKLILHLASAKADLRSGASAMMSQAHR